jgi:hypothetical protein
MIRGLLTFHASPTRTGLGTPEPDCSGGRVPFPAATISRDAIGHAGRDRYSLQAARDRESVSGSGGTNQSDKRFDAESNGGHDDPRQSWGTAGTPKQWITEES